MDTTEYCNELRDEMLDAIPCIIQSAFYLKNGKRIIVYTGSQGIVSYECDENWKPYPTPFATCPKEYFTEDPKEYHLSIRKLHGAEALNIEHSTDF